MKKNKGLTPSRKKEVRNPRVRNKNKFNKAQKRRKGQVCRRIYYGTRVRADAVSHSHLYRVSLRHVRVYGRVSIQVVDMRDKAKKYSGEAFGIRTDIAKSVKLK